MDGRIYPAHQADIAVVAAAQFLVCLKNSLEQAEVFLAAISRTNQPVERGNL